MTAVADPTFRWPTVSRRVATPPLLTGDAARRMGPAAATARATGVSTTRKVQVMFFFLLSFDEMEGGCRLLWPSRLKNEI